MIPDSLMGTRIDEMIQKRFADGGHCSILSWHPRTLFFCKRTILALFGKTNPSHILKTNLGIQPIFNVHDIWGDLNMLTCIVHINASFSRRNIGFHEASVAPNSLESLQEGEEELQPDEPSKTAVDEACQSVCCLFVQRFQKL